MELNNWLVALIGCLLLVAGVFAGAGMFSTHEVEKVYVDQPVITEKIVEIAKDCPVVEKDDLKDDFYENYFDDEYSDIKDEAEDYAVEELEDHDYEVVVDYLKTLLTEGQELDEDSVSVDVEDVNIEVYKLGLEDDEDKAATIEFELKVKYKLEEGETTKFKKNINVKYDVVFDEGDFNDEDVELVSIA